MLLYAAASLLHFAHNAVYIDEYPNLPAWLSAADVWLAWLAEFALGVAGFVLMRRHHFFIGHALVAVWAALGFDGLAHYALAPPSAHTLAMNATIWTEVCAAGLLSIAIAWRVAQRLALTRSRIDPSR
jgi:hypothetical protein